MCRVDKDVVKELRKQLHLPIGYEGRSYEDAVAALDTVIDKLLVVVESTEAEQDVLTEEIELQEALDIIYNLKCYVKTCEPLVLDKDAEETEAE